MPKKFFISLLSVAAAAAMASAVSAASIFDITFPIPELGNCANKTECKAYCDDLAHGDACAAFAQNHGLGSGRGAERKESLPSVGPGGCTSTSACKTYCDDTSHFDECIRFGEAHGLMSKKEIQQARSAVAKGPGDCSSIEECKQYCSDVSHRVACADYAHKQGQISDNDFKIVKEVTQQGGPGGCKNDDECHRYCQNADHLDECLSFAQAHGFISSDDAVAIRKAGFGGAGPGGCKGNDACRAYCQASEHQNECIDFADSHGLMTKEEADRARKFAGKTGPGGCTNEETCRAYCSDASHAENCLAAGQETGLISSQDALRARKLIQAAEQGGPGGCKGPQECQAYCQDPAHQEECFAFAKKQGLISAEDDKQFQAGIQIRKTVEQNGGPGGCKNDQECKTYCTDGAHTEECVAFASANGGVSDAQARSMLQEFTSRKLSETSSSPEEFQQARHSAVSRFQEFKQLERQFRKFGAQQGLSSPNPNQESGQSGAPPGEFPGQQPGEGGPASTQAGAAGFVGPGGCTNSAECIKYCSEHKEECFRQMSPEGMQNKNDNNEKNQMRQGNGFFPPSRPGSAPAQSMSGPQLRGNIVHEIKSQDLPQGFEQRTPEAKQQFFREKFRQLQGESGGSQHEPSQGSGENSRQERPPSDQSQGDQGEESSLFRGVGPQSGTPGMLAPLQKQDRSGSGPNSFHNFPPQGKPPMMRGNGSPVQGTQDQGTFQDQNRPGSQENFGQTQSGANPMRRPPVQEQFGGQSGQPGGQNQFPPNGQFQQPPGKSDGQHQGGDNRGFFPSSGAPSGGEFPQQRQGSGTGNFQPPSAPSGGGPFPGQSPPSGSGGSFGQQTQPPSFGGSNGFMPPPSGSIGGGFPSSPPSGGTGGFQPPPPSGNTGGSPPLPSGGFQPPPPPPSSMVPPYDFFAALFHLFTASR